MSRTTRGFSLIELLVSLAIIALITATILARYSAFNSTVLLKDLAYEVALSLREAQSYGVSVRGSGGFFNRTYGMHFAPNATSYTLFSDINGNGRYDSGEAITTYQIGNNNRIGNLCANTNCSLTALDVMYRRPEPDALFFSTPNVSGITSARIVVSAPNGASHTVFVYPTGQISIE